MPMSTPHMIILVILMNSLLAIAGIVNETYENATYNTTTDITGIMNQTGNQQTQIQTILLKNGLLRENSGDTPQFAEAGINTGAMANVWQGLTISVLIPLGISTLLEIAMQSGLTIIGVLAGTLSLIILGTNLMLYKRFADIIFAKLTG